MLHLYHGNILGPEVDAIVNAANSSLMGGGGVDGAIHRAAGPALKEACRPLAPCPPGAVRVTEGFRLAPRLIFHTVGPVWRSGGHNEASVLEACYRNCLNEAAARALHSIAFPAISTGIYGFPVDLAAQIAVNTCKEAIEGNELDVYLVAFDDLNAQAISALLDQVRCD